MTSATDGDNHVAGELIQWGSIAVADADELARDTPKQIHADGERGATPADSERRHRTDDDDQPRGDAARIERGGDHPEASRDHVGAEGGDRIVGEAVRAAAPALGEDKNDRRSGQDSEGRERAGRDDIAAEDDPKSDRQGGEHPGIDQRIVGQLLPHGGHRTLSERRRPSPG